MTTRFGGERLLIATLEPTAVALLKRDDVIRRSYREGLLPDEQPL